MQCCQKQWDYDTIAAIPYIAKRFVKVSHWLLLGNEMYHNTLFVSHITDRCRSGAICQKYLQRRTKMPKTSNLFHLKFHIPGFVTGQEGGEAALLSGRLTYK